MQQLAAAAGLSTVADAIRTLSDLRSTDSLIAYTQPARVEPITLVDADCLLSEMTPDVMQSLLSLVSGYYLQAWAMSATLGNISVMRQLERLNPSRDPVAAALGRAAVAAEGLQDHIGNFTLSMEGLNFAKSRLPRPKDPRNSTLAMEAIALEATQPAGGSQSNQQAGGQLSGALRAAANRYDEADPKTNGKSDDIKAVHEVVNLSVGKLLKVNLKGDNGNSIDIPVSIRLLVNSIDSQAMTHILSIGSKDNSFKERYHAWRAGQLSLVKDLILCQDLIDEHRRTLVKDTTGLYSAIRNRSSGNTIAGLISNNMSVATASNIAVISSTTAARLEAQVGGKLSNFATRQKIFEKTYLMLLAVIDKEQNRVTIYHRGIPESSSLNHREIKGSNKGSGPDVADILNAYRSGQSPGL